MAKSFPFFGLFSFPSYFDCILTFAFAFPSRSFVCFLWGSGGGLHKAVDVSIMQEEEHDEGGGKQRDRGPAGWLARRLGLLRGRSDWFLCNEYAGRLSNDNRFIGGWKCVPTHSYSPFSRRSRRYRSEERKKKKEGKKRTTPCDVVLDSNILCLVLCNCERIRIPLHSSALLSVSSHSLACGYTT